jgi:hypothetical protein
MPENLEPTSSVAATMPHITATMMAANTSFLYILAPIHNWTQNLKNGG